MHAIRDDKQARRQAGRQAGRRAGRRADRQTDRQTGASAIERHTTICQSMKATCCKTQGYIKRKQKESVQNPVLPIAGHVSTCFYHHNLCTDLILISRARIACAHRKKGEGKKKRKAKNRGTPCKGVCTTNQTPTIVNHAHISRASAVASAQSATLHLRHLPHRCYWL